MPSYRKQRAFSLAELLLAIAILGALLAAVAIGGKAFLLSYAENEDIATTVQTARMILTKLSTEVRTAAAVGSTDTQLTIFTPDDGSGLQQVQYDFTGGTLYYRRTVNGNTTSHVLLGAGDDATVTTFFVLREIGQDWKGFPCTKSITIRMEIQADNATFSVTVTACPRRNQDY